MRRMYGACEWQAGDLMSYPSRDALWGRDHHHRGPGHPRQLASHASGIRCVRRIPVRILHVRPDHVGRCIAQGTLRSRRCGGEGTDERQHLPLRSLCQYRGRDPTSSQKHLAASRSDSMHTFEFVRPADSAAAVVTAAQAKTAQQGADVRFVAGGTTLLDLMKLNVETPARVIDINRLPLDKIEATADGGLKIGATVRNSDLAHYPTVERDYAVLSQALLAGASAQLATWQPRPVIYCSARAVCTSATPPCPATNESPEPDARRLTAPIACSLSWAPANTASQPTPRTCASRWRHWKRRSTYREAMVRARSPSVTFIFCPAAHRIAKQYSNQVTSSPTSRSRRPSRGAGRSI